MASRARPYGALKFLGYFKRGCCISYLRGVDMSAHWPRDFGRDAAIAKVFQLVLLQEIIDPLFNTYCHNLLLLKSMAREFERAAVFGDGAYHVVRGPVWNLGLNFQSDRHIGAH